MKRGYKTHTEIFSGALWSQRHLWRGVDHLLPPNACLLVYDDKDQKQTQLMKRVARSFLDRKRFVYGWSPRGKLKPLRVKDG